MVKMRFGKIVTAVDAVHYLKWIAGFKFFATFLDPAHERRSLGRVAQAHQSIQSEGCIANPGVSVIPIAHSADLFREPERGSRHHRSMLCRGEHFQNQRGTIYHFAPAATIMRAPNPRLPEIRRLLKGVWNIILRGRTRRIPVAGVLEYKSRGLPGSKREIRGGSSIFYFNCLLGAQPQHRFVLSFTDEQGVVLAAFDTMPGPAVVKAWIEDHAKAQIPAHRFGPTHQIVTMAQICDRHEIGNFTHPFIRQEASDENH